MVERDIARTDVACVIGRFQVHELHEGHRYLLDTAKAHSSRLFIFVGVHPRLTTTKDPLDFSTRAAMLRVSYPDATIVPLFDQPSNKRWSELLDASIRSLNPTGTVKLWGGRDSFAGCYSGSYPVQEIKMISDHSGTAIRALAGFEIQNSPDFRRGVTYATHQLRTRVWPTVDIAALRWCGPDAKYKDFPGFDKVDLREMTLCLGTKLDQPGLYRLPGGFVEAADSSLEAAACREATEETGLDFAGHDSFIYIGSYLVRDWRDTESDRVMTALFTTFYRGSGRANDDLSTLSAVPIPSVLELLRLGNRFADDHGLLVTKVLQWMYSKQDRELPSNEECLDVPNYVR